jgi:uncharacterized protein HemX
LARPLAWQTHRNKKEHIMNSTLSTVDRRHGQPPDQVVVSQRVTSPQASHQPSTTIRVGVLDQVALHVGIALVKWGRRPASVESRERRANRVEQQLASLARERAVERHVRLTSPVR